MIAADVLGVALAAAGDDLRADRVELAAEVLDVLRAQVRGGVVGLLLHGGHGGSSQSSISQGPAAADTQVWTSTGRAGPLSGEAVVRSPLRRSRTAPSRSGATQPKQMPMRQPEGISTPASSPASSSDVAPSASTSIVAGGEGHGPAVAGGQDGGAEALGVEALGDPSIGPAALERVEHPGGSAGPGLALVEVADQAGELLGVEHAVGVGVALDELDAPARGQHPQLAGEDDVLGGRRRVHDDDVAELVERVAQHPHHRRDAAAGGDEQDLVRARVGQDELAAGLVEVDEHPDPRAAHDVGADHAFGDRLDGDRDAAVGPVDRRRQRVRAPLAHAVDVEADPDVLAWDVPGPAAPGPDHQGHGVAGLGVDLDDPPAQVGAGAQRAHEVEVVGREQRRGHQPHEVDRAVTEAGGDGARGERSGHGIEGTCASKTKFLSMTRERAARICSERTR